jgi:S-adenosylmethionine:tRNA ribosyltransferase-isomerase
MSSAINIQDYFYDLPDGKIARHPLAHRDQSRLLIYRDGTVTHSSFSHLEDFLPRHTQLFFNDTKVIPARLLFHKNTGAEIEIFLLHPDPPSVPADQAMLTCSEIRWSCIVGNQKRWNSGSILEKSGHGLEFKANLIDKDKGLVHFSWSPSSLTFAEVLQEFGVTPLPPYLHRSPEPDDRERYQTVYSQRDGAVAAPTAGLHFTPEILASFKSRGVPMQFLTLHVSAGTFQPVKASDAREHSMHEEQIILSENVVESLLTPGLKNIAVGTTSLRTLESLYWYGVMLMSNQHALLDIPAMFPYNYSGTLPSSIDAFSVIRETMRSRNERVISGSTSIYILPGYDFKVCDGLLTNFHQPGSTLLLLVSAFTQGNWKKIYDEALDKDYRFLSYGDCSLLLR